MSLQIKVKLLELHKKQADLILELHKRGYNVSPSEFSRYLSGLIQSKKANSVLEEASKILKEWKGDNENKEKTLEQLIAENNELKKQLAKFQLKKRRLTK